MGPTGTLWDATAERYRNSHANLILKKVNSAASKDKAGSVQDIYLCRREKNHMLLIVTCDKDSKGAMCEFGHVPFVPEAYSNSNPINNQASH